LCPVNLWDGILKIHFLLSLVLIIGIITAISTFLGKFLSLDTRRLLLCSGVVFLPASYTLRLVCHLPLALFPPMLATAFLSSCTENSLSSAVSIVSCVITRISLCIALSSSWLSSGVSFCIIYRRVSCRFVVTFTSFCLNVVLGAVCFLLPAANLYFLFHGLSPRSWCSILSNMLIFLS